MVRRTLLAERVSEAMISVAFVTSREIARLNREHLGHAGPTDVISFALGSSSGAGRGAERVSPSGATGFALRRALRGHTSSSAASPVEGPVVGDIYICADVVRKNVARFGVGIREEIARVVVHGTLHALGYEHADGEERTDSVMWRKQEAILERVL